MPTLSVLSCPVCGAPLKADDAHCTFCGSVVVIRSDLPRIDPNQLNRAVINKHIAEYRATVRRDNNDETAHYGLGVAYFSLGLLDEAADEFAQAARLMPENPNIQSQLAFVLAELARKGHADANQRAEDRVEKALLLDPQHTEALIIKARLLGRRQEWANAAEVLRKAAKRDPDQVNPKLVTALLNQADDHQRKGRWVKAASCWREAAALDALRVRPKLISFLAGNAAFLDDHALKHLNAIATHGGPYSDAPPSGTRGRSIAIAVLSLLGSCVVFMVGAGIAGSQPKGATGEGIGFWLMLFALVAGVISPFVPLLIRKVKARRSAQNALPDAGGRKQQPPARPEGTRRDRRRLKEDLLAGRTHDISPMVNASLLVAKRREHQDAERAKKAARRL